MPEPLASRREILSQTLATHSDPRIVASQGVTGSGCAYFENILALELEGMMAKRLSSPYRPGQRTDDWQKIKRQRTLLCAVIGYIPSPDRARDFRSLLIAAEIDGQLVSVGKVGSGFDEASHARTLAYLLANERHSPIIPCPDKGRWVQPGLYCTVAYFERTRTGQLRAPVFKGFHPA